MFERGEIAFDSYRQEFLYRLNVGFMLGHDLVNRAMREVLHLEEAQKRDVYLGILLNGLMARGGGEEEIAGLLDAAFELDGFDPRRREHLTIDGRTTITVAGSGKKGFKTFNISTFACFVAACDDIVVLKPCSRATSSKTGSADLAELLGIRTLENDEAGDVVSRTNIGLFGVERIVPRFNSLYGGRFFAPHALSFALAGLLVPFKTDVLLYGLSHPNLTLALKVFRSFQVPSALVVTATYDGIHYVDETLPFGTSYFQGYRRDRPIGRMVGVEANQHLGLPRHERRSIAQEADPRANALKGLCALSGVGDPAARDTVALGAANLLYLGGRVETLETGYKRALQLIERGEPIERLKHYISLTGGSSATLSSYLKEVEYARSTTHR